MTELVIRPIETACSPAVDRLVRESAGEGFRFLLRLQEEYASGANRFDAEGEALLGLRMGGELVSVGGLNRDPYGGLSGAGRLRHLYVLPSFRRAGLGSELLKALLECAGRNGFDQLVLRTDTASAAAFYESHGFERVTTIPGATHRLRLADPGSAALTRTSTASCCRRTASAP